MAALLEERSKRQKGQRNDGTDETISKKANGDGERSLQSLVESVKRKSMAAELPGSGKRRKV